MHGGFQIHPGSAVGFRIGPYDPSLPLCIDPVLSYSTFLGGNRFDSVTSMAVDAAGKAYLTGWTESTDFPTSGPLQAGNRGGVDVFVAKLNPSGALVYSTYIGGSGDDRGFGIASDPAGSAYVTGWTSSDNFPAAAPFQAAFAGRRDAFVLKLNPAGNALAYSTYLGGRGGAEGFGEEGRAIAVDGSGNAYVTGTTSSTNFPLLNPIRSTPAGTNDAFVSKLNPAGNALLYSTLLGGSGTDIGAAIAVDPQGSAVVSGYTSSPDFPTTFPAQPSHAGLYDVFLTRLRLRPTRHVAAPSSPQSRRERRGGAERC